ncbi:phytoene desaturase family protein [Pseudalkalibacillus sp. Hm43]|uniref:phytoene desaturase family protein n=1 Tax=Pseudalkalibacillus sp. Hm43 TaxID=3450742 RepID=UPI003F41F4F3
MAKKAVIIGGGLGGLSAAIRLKADGYDVEVFEKNERVGGKLNQRAGNGFTFDTGPSILTMPWVLEQLFESAGRNLNDYVKLKKLDPQWRTFFEDGKTIDVSADLSSWLNEIKQKTNTEASDFLEYLQYCTKMYELSMKSFYGKSLSGLSDLRKLHSFKDLLQMDPMKSMHEKTRSYIKDPHLQQLLDFFIMYIGSSPYHAPAVLSQLVHVQLGLGIYYVEGGMYQIANAMVRLLDELEVPIHTNAKIDDITYKRKKATGIRLENGEEIPADIVVSNLEAIPAHRSLLSQHKKSNKELKELNKYEPTVSGLVMLLGIDKQYDQLLHHNFFFSKDPEKEFRQIFDEKVPADDPTVYIGVSSKSDMSQAPEGKDNLFILTHVPPLKEGESWETFRETYRQTVLRKLERMGLEDIENHIEFQYEFIPDDLERLYGSNGGSIYGVVTDRKVNGGFKVPARSNLLKNLYFVGGSTHPGGGVPMVTLSGQLTADLILEDA